MEASEDRSPPSLRLLRLRCQAGRQPTADKCITFVKIVITWNESHYAFARGALQRTINIMIENVFTQVYSITNMSRISLVKNNRLCICVRPTNCIRYVEMERFVSVCSYSKLLVLGAKITGWQKIILIDMFL